MPACRENDSDMEEVAFRRSETALQLEFNHAFGVIFIPDSSDEELSSITGMPASEATQFLEMAGGNLEAAISLYFEMGGGGGDGGGDVSMGGAGDVIMGDPIPVFTPPTPAHGVLFGSEAAPASWLEQGFEFSDAEGSALGIVQHKNGPCGVLAAVNGVVVARAGCPCPSTRIDDEDTLALEEATAEGAEPDDLALLETALSDLRESLDPEGEARRRRLEEAAAKAEHEIVAQEAEEERLAAEAAAKAEQDRLAMEAAAKAVEERIEKEAAAKAEEQRIAQEAEEERLAAEAAAKAEQDILAKEATAKAEEERIEKEAAAKAEQVAGHDTAEVQPKCKKARLAEQEGLVEIEKGPDTITLCLRLGIVMVKEELPDEDAPALAELAPAEQEDIQQHQPGSRQLDLREMLQSDGDDDDHVEEEDVVETWRQWEEEDAVEKKERGARDRQSFVTSGSVALTVLESRDPELFQALLGCLSLLESVENREVLWRYVQIQDKAKKWYREKAQEYFVQQLKLLVSLFEQNNVDGALQHLQETMTKVEQAMSTMPEKGQAGLWGAYIPEIFAPRASAASSGPVELD